MIQVVTVSPTVAAVVHPPDTLNQSSANYSALRTQRSAQHQLTVAELLSQKHQQQQQQLIKKPQEPQNRNQQFQSQT